MLPLNIVFVEATVEANRSGESFHELVRVFLKPPSPKLVGLSCCVAGSNENGKTDQTEVWGLDEDGPFSEYFMGETDFGSKNVEPLSHSVFFTDCCE